MPSLVSIDPMEFDRSPFRMLKRDWMVVSAAKPDGSINCMTASWGGFGIMWNKPVAYVVIRPQRYTKEFVDASPLLSLSFFDGIHRQDLLYLGTASGRNEDKLAKVGFDVGMMDGAPIYKQADITIICEKLYEQPVVPSGFVHQETIGTHYPETDFHTMYICEIKEIWEMQYDEEERQTIELREPEKL